MCLTSVPAPYIAVVIIVKRFLQTSVQLDLVILAVHELLLGLV